MKKGFIRYAMNGCLLVIMMFILSGCGFAEKLVDKMLHGDMAGVSTECTVNSVDGTLGSREFVCKNSFNTYVYHNGNICNADTMEELLAVEWLECMSCNDEVLWR